MLARQDCNFPKDSRLRKKADFSTVLGHRKKHQTKNFLFYYADRASGENSTRIGISVSRKCGKAPVRNYFKRVVREFFRSSKWRSLGLDVVVVVKRVQVTASNSRKVMPPIESARGRGRSMTGELENFFTTVTRELS